jgi:hypothetical protein
MSPVHVDADRSTLVNVQHAHEVLRYSDSPRNARNERDVAIVKKKTLRHPVLRIPE